MNVHAFHSGNGSRTCSKTIGYVTDIEGNYDFWQRYLAISNVLYKSSDGVIQLKNECEFVYGGDICDRGPGTSFTIIYFSSNYYIVVAIR
jgi:hypothetical protein